MNSTAAQAVAKTAGRLEGTVARERGGDEVALDVRNRHGEARGDVGVRKSIDFAQREHLSGVGGEGAYDCDEVVHRRIVDRPLSRRILRCGGCLA